MANLDDDRSRRFSSINNICYVFSFSFFQILFFTIIQLVRIKMTDACMIEARLSQKVVLYT